jgi:hypothetical protein
MTVTSGEAEVEVPRTEAELARNRQAIDQLKARAPRPPKTRVDWVIQLVRDFCALVALVALSIGLINFVAQSKTVACEASLLENFSSQSAAQKDAVTALVNVAKVNGIALDNQAKALNDISDPAKSVEDRRAALEDFEAQAQQMAAAWQSYVEARQVATDKQAANPVTFRC